MERIKKMRDIFFMCTMNTKKLVHNWFSLFVVSLVVLRVAEASGYSTRIVGGSNAPSNSWPYIVNIGGCSGNLVTNEWILTAAHCVDGRKTKNMKVTLGTNSRNGIGSNAVTRTISRVCCHRGYNPTTFANDICALRLSSPVTLNKHIQKIGLPSSGSRASGVCKVAGWGKDEHGQLPDTLKEASVKVLNLKECNSWYSEHGDIPEGHFCAGYKKGGVDTCFGDSGGPIMCKKGVLSGITSFGDAESCGKQKRPGVYVEVAFFKKWIEAAISGKCPSYYSWGSWKNGTCSVTCGKGTLRRERKCMENKNLAVSDLKCKGKYKETVACEKSPCLTHTWSEWKEESCSVTCGTGVIKKTRTCMYRGSSKASSTKCKGKDEDESPCTKKECVVYFWSKWKDGSCSVTCGKGSMKKTRTCLYNINYKTSNSKCDGDYKETVSCTEKQCVVYVWSKWKDGSCSVTCGKGSMKKTRTCLYNNKSKTSNSKCDGDYKETVSCSEKQCVVYTWSTWTSWVCSVTCGKGFSTRTRHCLKDSRSTHLSRCRENYLEKKSCTNKEDCIVYSWQPWSMWTAYSVSCGIGSRIRLRSCVQNNKGVVSNTKCNGPSTQNIVFSQGICKVYSWQPWNLWTSCSVSCGHGSIIRSRLCVQNNKGIVSNTKCNGPPTQTNACFHGICKGAEGQNDGACGVSVDKLAAAGEVGGDKTACLKIKNSAGEGCWSDGECFLKPASKSSQRRSNQDTLGDKLENWRVRNPSGFKRPTNSQIKTIVTNMGEKAKATPGKASPGIDKRKVQQSSKRLSLSGLGGLLTGLSLYPECPVHVKYCHRVPCGGFNRPDLQRDGNRCLRDPRCCFDYELAFMKSIFGSRFMGDTPTCYYGATSKQWIWMTSLINPWNPFLATVIRDAFSGIFDIASIAVGGQFACALNILPKAYPVGEKSKVQCSLVSGCWDGSKPKGSRCSMASDLFSQFTGGQVYPSLFTNDPSDTQCSNNWFDFGPKAYRRMNCGIGAPPPGLIDKIKWCPIQECCLNYQGLDLSFTDQLLLQSIGGGGGLGGFVGGGGGGGAGLAGLLTGLPLSGPSFGTSPSGGFDAQTLQYLLLSGSSSSSLDLKDLFCPYRLIIKSSLFPDMSELTEGCCEIPRCYHKKKLVSFQNPVPPPTRARWGAWGACNAQCGRPGTQTRRCLVGNREQPGYCSGPPTQQCSGAPCPVFGSWGQWQQSSACNGQCGQGTAQYYRQCLVNGQPSQNPASCPGGQTSQTTTRPCNLPPCTPAPVFGSWGAWQQSSPCNVQCGQGTIERRRVCLVNGQQSSNPSVCPNGQLVQTQTSPCTKPPCAPMYRWNGEFKPVQECSAECGTGQVYYGQQCVDRSNQVVSSNLCPGTPQYQLRQCNTQPCQPTASWGPWRVISACDGRCGQHAEIRRRYCSLSTGAVSQDTSLCGGGNAEQVRSCANACKYYWSGWVNDLCQQDQFGRYCRVSQVRITQRYCYEMINNRLQYIADRTRCGRPVEEYRKTIPCVPQECRNDAP